MTVGRGVRVGVIVGVGVGGRVGEGEAVRVGEGGASTIAALIAVGVPAAVLKTLGPNTAPPTISKTITATPTAGNANRASVRGALRAVG